MTVIPLTVIPSSTPNANQLAGELVQYGHAEAALVMYGDHVLYEARRISDHTYAWRTSTMGASAFHPLMQDNRPDVYGMPRWQWDLYGRMFPATPATEENCNDCADGC